MLLSIFISAVAVNVSTVGMKCTRFMDGRADSKSFIAVTGGVMFIVSGVFSGSRTGRNLPQLASKTECLNSVLGN